MVESLRTLLVDPVCVSTRGHNLPLLLDYRQFLCSQLDVKAEIHVTDLLPTDLYSRDDLHGTFPFPYMFNRQLVKNLGLKGSPASSTLEADLATAFARLIEAENRPLHLVFPYADFMGVVACAQATEETPPVAGSRVSLRFIGVMETSSPPGIEPMSTLRTAIAQMRQSGLQVGLAAESAPYASELSSHFAEPVELVPPPAPMWVRHASTDTDYAPEAPFVYCPGSGRDDKGFTELPTIISHYRRQYPQSPLEFVCQEPTPSRDPLLHQAHVRLQALPGVHVLPSLIDMDDMASLYATCLFAMLPYSRGTYEFRSSASLADAFGAGTPVLTYSGTGLESYVTHYGMGRVVPDLPSLVDACYDMSLSSASSWDRRTAAATLRYDADTVVAWLRWLQKGVAS